MSDMRDDRMRPPPGVGPGLHPQTGRPPGAGFNPAEELTPDALARHIAPEPPRRPGDRPRAAAPGARQVGRAPKSKKAALVDLWHRKPIVVAGIGAGAMVLLSLLVFGLVALLGPASAPPAMTPMDAGLPNEGPDASGQDMAAAPQGASAEPAEAPAPPKPVMTVSSLIETQPAAAIPFPVSIEGSAELPPGSLISISGLPAGAEFSAGQSTGQDSWRLQAGEAGDLLITVPADTAGSHALQLTLTTPQGALLAEAASRLVVRLPPEIQAVVDAEASQADPAAAEGGSAASPEPVETAFTQPDAAPAADAPVSPSAQEAAGQGAGSQEPSSLGSPPDDAAAAAGGKWMVVTTAVNMRAEPSSTGQTVTVMQQGKRLKVTDDQYGWLKVTDPDGGQDGWIYKKFLKDAE